MRVGDVEVEAWQKWQKPMKEIKNKNEIKIKIK